MLIKKPINKNPTIDNSYYDDEIYIIGYYPEKNRKRYILIAEEGIFTGHEVCKKYIDYFMTSKYELEPICFGKKENVNKDEDGKIKV